MHRYYWSRGFARFLAARFRSIFSSEVSLYFCVHCYYNSIIRIVIGFSEKSNRISLICILFVLRVFCRYLASGMLVANFHSFQESFHVDAEVLLELKEPNFDLGLECTVMPRLTW